MPVHGPGSRPAAVHVRATSRGSPRSAPYPHGEGGDTGAEAAVVVVVEGVACIGNRGTGGGTGEDVGPRSGGPPLPPRPGPSVAAVSCPRRPAGRDPGRASG